MNWTGKKKQIKPDKSKKKKPEKEAEQIKIKRPVGRPRKNAFKQTPDTTPPDKTTPPDTTPPDTTPPDTTPPDTTQPDTTQPDTTQPDTTPPDTTPPDTTPPDTTPQKEITQADIDKIFDDTTEAGSTINIPQLDSMINTKGLAIFVFGLIASIRRKALWNLNNEEAEQGSKILKYLLEKYKDKLKQENMFELVLIASTLQLIGTKAVQDFNEEREKREKIEAEQEKQTGTQTPDKITSG